MAISFFIFSIIFCRTSFVSLILSLLKFKTHNLTKTAQLCNCSPDSVSKIVKARGAKVSPAISLSKAVGKVDIITGEILEVYNSVNEAERDNGNTRHIAEVCNGKRKTCKGFKWIFLE